MNEINDRFEILILDEDENVLKTQETNNYLLALAAVNCARLALEQDKVIVENQPLKAKINKIEVVLEMSI